MRRALLGLTLAGLAACGETGFRMPSLDLFGGYDATAEGIRTLSLLDGAVRVRGPQGYCVDQGASRADAGFAILVGCALVSPDVSIMPSLDGLILVQFGEAGSAAVVGNEEGLSALLETGQGRGLLSRPGNPQTVQIAVVNSRANRVFVRVADSAGTGIEGTEDSLWRGFMDVSGRLTTVSVLSFDRAPLSRDRAKSLLELAMATIEEVNSTAETVLTAAESGG